MTDAAVIVSTIERKGWQVAPVATGWQLAHPAHGLTCYLSTTPSWLCLYAPESKPGSDNDRLRAALLRCEAHFMTRWALDAAGNLGASVELPLDADLHLVDTALTTLVRSAVPDAVSGADRADSGGAVSDRSAKELYFNAAPGIPEESVAYYLRAMEPWGWGIKSKPQGITWRLGYKGQRLFEVFLTISPAWAYFHVPLLADAPALHRADPALAHAFLAYLLRLNDAWYMAKVGLDDAGNVLLMLDVPTLALDFEMFRRVTRLLGTYLDYTAREVQIMARLEADPHLCAILSSEE